MAQEVNSPTPTASGKLPASVAADTSEVFLVRFIMAALVLLPTATPAGVITAELEGVLRGMPQELIQEAHQWLYSLSLINVN